MPDGPAKPKRFRVALSFPGEHRARVEKIARLLAVRLHRDQILYDKWHDAEFARPNLNVHLSGLCRDESELLVYVLRKEHAEKPWTGLEWSVALDLVQNAHGHRLMYLRLDDFEIPGLSKFDGYLDIRNLPESDVAAKILIRLGMPSGEAPRTFISKLPIVNPLLIGRDPQLAFLDRAWDNPATNFVQVIAAGGTGKTALIDKWFRRHLGEATVFGWSFYSQGTSADRQTSSDPFFAEILAWLHIEIAPTASIYAKAEAVARVLREERVLLLLGGVEPLQDSTGTLRDAALKALLLELDTANRGLVVCTTRVRLDIPDDAPRVESIDLDNLTPEQRAQYLRSLKVEGTDEELQDASREYWNHALALTLLGTYLVDFCGTDIRRRIEIPTLAERDSHAHRVIAAYERMFAGKPEIDILRALGYFDRPAEPEALKLVLPAIDVHTYRAALNRLHRARLILTRDPVQPLDCHPLVREHFAATATREGHGRLYEHYTKQAPHRPDTLEEMTPLFYAVYHGGQAGQHQASLDDVYRDRIRRGDKSYLLKNLGAFGTDISLLANLFATPWTQPIATLSPAAQPWVRAHAGFILRAVGRLADAVEPMRAAADAAVESENLTNAAIGYGNLSEIHLTLGNVNEAVAAARQTVDFADRGGDGHLRVRRRATLADTVHQSGDLSEATRLFAEAERLLVVWQTEYPILYSVAGYRYCDLLLAQGQTAEVIRRASQDLDLDKRFGDLLSFGLDHLSLGRAHPAASAESTHHLDQAVDFLRRSGQLDDLPLGLLARGTTHDLEEVFRIATRSGMRLHLADYHLAKGNLKEAEALIDETGYHRRDPELAALRARVNP